MTEPVASTTSPNPAAARASHQIPGPARRLEAVAVDVELRGGSMRTYRTLLLSLDLTAGGEALPSCLFHWVEISAGGIVIHEVWADRPVWEEVLIDFLLPAASILGLPAPAVTVRTVAGYLVGPR